MSHCVIEWSNYVVEKTVSRALGGHGTSPKRRCERSPDPNEVSSLGKLSVFLKSLIGTLGTSFIAVLEMFPNASNEWEIDYSDSKKLCFALAISRMALKRILAKSDMVCGVRVLGLSFVV